MKAVPALDSIPAIVSAALHLVGSAELPPAEQALAARTPRHDVDVRAVRRAIMRGDDPLGTAYAVARASAERRVLGQTYTPPAIVTAMLDWAAAQPSTPEVVVDPGAGSGRYIAAAARRFPDARLVAVDVDPLATLMTRATLAVTGNLARAEVLTADFRSLPRPPADGAVLYIGNPPYVRHHQIDPHWKRWLASTAKRMGLQASALAGLHAYFYLATAQQAKPGDMGTFITSAEWLDVNYGKLVRQLLVDQLGASSVHLLEPTLEVFPDTQATGAIACFRVGDPLPSSVRFRRVKSIGQLGDLTTGKAVARQRLRDTNRWTVLTRATPKMAEGWVELGELCRVHRGAVTGANAVWVRGRDGLDLPASVLYPSVTKARELFAAGTELADASGLRVVIDLPADLDELSEAEAKRVRRFLAAARRAGAHTGYVAENRRAWWSVGLRAPAPILATYMARRTPAFVRNRAGARHINIAHGIYPRQPMDAALLDTLAAHLRESASLRLGRTYAGGLTKFEPREMERVPVPHPDLLTDLLATT